MSNSKNRNKRLAGSLAALGTQAGTPSASSTASASSGSSLGVTSAQRKQKKQTSSNVVQVPSQSLNTQLALQNLAFNQNLLAQTFGANLDRTNADYFNTLDLAKYRDQSAEDRLNIKTSGVESRATAVAQGEQDRLSIGTRYAGELQLTNAQIAGQQALAHVTGEEERLSIGARYAGETALQAGKYAGETGLIETQGAQTRQNISAQGTQDRLNIATSGEQERLNIGARYAGEQGLERTRGEEERKTVVTSGEQQRETIGRTASEQRATDLQQEMFRRYKENRDYTQAQTQYRA